MVAQLLLPRDSGKKPRSLLARLDSHAIPRRVTAVLALVGVALGSLSQSGGPDRVDACKQGMRAGTHQYAPDPSSSTIISRLNSRYATVCNPMLIRRWPGTYQWFQG